MSNKTDDLNSKSYIFGRLLPAAFLWLFILIISLLLAWFPNFSYSKVIAENILPNAAAFADVLMVRVTMVAIAVIGFLFLFVNQIFHLKPEAKRNQRQFIARAVDDMSSALTHLGCAMFMSIFLTSGQTAATWSFVIYFIENISIAYLLFRAPELFIK